MNKSEETCQHLKVLDERITRERELREAFEEKLDERDRRYEDRFKSQQSALKAALDAQEKLTNAAFDSSEKAITKAETSQTVYNANHNDLSRKMEAQYKEMLPRSEAESKFKGLEDKIADLREYRSGQGGSDRGKAVAWAFAVVLIGWGLVIVAFLLKK